MGSIYSREILGYKNPRVGILSIGTEETKGNELTLEAFKLCKQLSLNFIGNVEGHDLFTQPGGRGRLRRVRRQHRAEDLREPGPGHVLAAQEGADGQSPRPARRVAGPNAFRTIKRRMDPEGYGGAPLLGFNGTVMKAHGSARERAIANAIRVTTENIQHHVNDLIAGRSPAPTSGSRPRKTTEPVTAFA